MGVGHGSATPLAIFLCTGITGPLAGGTIHGKGWNIAWHRQQSR
jgi:hypothetical protein